MPNTCKLTQEWRVTREELQKFANEADNIESARANSPYHRESAGNPRQIEFIEELRQHYIKNRCNTQHEVVVRKFKLPEHFEWDTKNEPRRAVLLNGLYRADEHNHVDFANKNIGGGFLTYGAAQEEIICFERTDLGMLIAMMYAKGTHFTIDDDEALTIDGADYCAGIDFYGRVPDDWDNKCVYFTEPKASIGSLIAIDCIRPRWKKYEREHIEWCIKKAYCGFQGTHGTDITTGQWGCGAFFNNKHVIFCVQALAAWLAGKKLFYHAGYRHVGKGVDLVASWGKNRTPLSKCIDELVARCDVDPEFETSWDPDLVQDEFAEVVLAGNLVTSTESLTEGLAEGLAEVSTDANDKDISKKRVMKTCPFTEYAKKKWPDFKG